MRDRQWPSLHWGGGHCSSFEARGWTMAECSRCGESGCSCWLDPPDDADKDEGFEPKPKVA